MKPALKTSDKAHAAKRERAAQFAKQTIVIDDHWRIQRLDVYNWQITHQGRFVGYFGSLTAAFKALPRKLLDDRAAGTLETILALEQSIQQMVEQSLKFKLA